MSFLSQTDAHAMARAILCSSLVLVGLLLVGIVVASLVRKRANRPEESATDFSLQQLRELHRKGLLSDEEYQRARAKMAAAVRREIDRPLK